MDDELLSNVDLKYYAKLFKINLIDVLSKDLFKNIKAIEGCYIINIQSSNNGNGTHWTSLLLIKNFAIYFDSYGIIMPNEILRFIKRYSFKKKDFHIIYSVDQIQSMESVFCGYYCLYFLYFITILNKKSSKFKVLLNIHNQLYELKDKPINDIILKRLIKSIIYK